jgi:hypothetical protein
MTDVTPPEPPFDNDAASTVQVESLFTTAMEAHNLWVEEHFDTLQNYNPQDPLLILRSQALIQSTDSLLEVIVRFWAFYVLVGKAAFFAPESYSIPITSYQEARHFYPQVTLHFKESPATVEPTFAPVYGEISFRIVKTPLVEITQAWTSEFAIQIKELLGLENFSWSKGWVRVNYQDRVHGYDFRLNVNSKGEGIRIIEAVLSLQGDAYNDSLIVVSQSDKTFPAIPPEQFLYGKERRGPRQRPVATVYFYRAVLHIHGVEKPIVLYDKSGRSRSAIVT